MIEAFIFDVDGTLIDSVDYHAEAWVKAFKKFGKNVKFYEARRQIGKGGDQFLPEFLLKKEIKEFGKAIEEERGVIFKRDFLSKIKPFPQVRELFEMIKSDEKAIVLASSANADEVGVYKKIARIEDLVGAETSADDAEKSKPEPDIFVAALRKLEKIKGKINKKNIVVIGDTAYDAEAAAKINLRTIGVSTGGWTERELLSAGCSEVYSNIATIAADYKEMIKS